MEWSVYDKMALREHPIPESERTQRIENLVSGLKSIEVGIPISSVVDIVYRPTGTNLQALVASSDFTEQTEGNLVYVKGGSQHGMLWLVDIPKEPAQGPLLHKLIDGHYDRDSKTRKITQIYIEKEGVTSASYGGTLTDLLNNPNISRR